MGTTRPKPFTRLLRGVTLRCPECGGSRILASWFRLKMACPTCHLLLDRGQVDFFLGAYVINLAVAEGSMAAIFAALVIHTWPNPPWDTLQWVAIACVVIVPFLTYPFTKVLWLAFDLIFQPPTDRDRPAG